MTLQKGSVSEKTAERVKEQVDKGDPQMPKCALDKSLHQKF